MKRFKFCKANNGWWLVISDIEQLLAYKDKTSSKYGHAIVNNAVGKENPYQRLYDTAEILASSHNISIVEAMCSLADSMTERQIFEINSGKTIWFNERGGWNYGLKDISATVYRDKILFPNYTEKDIRISKWGGGQHFYAKVGEIEVKEIVDSEVIMKWNTHSEAYKRALAYCIVEESE